VAERSYYHEYLESARTALDEIAQEKAQSEGEAMIFEEAVIYALMDV
jgi:hypothetical protein